MSALIARARAALATPAGRQVSRFVRLGLLAALAIWFAGGHVVTWAALWGALVGGAETIWRQLAPTVPAAQLGQPNGAGLGLPGIINPDEGTGSAGSEPSDPPAAPAPASS